MASLHICFEEDDIIVGDNDFHDYSQKKEVLKVGGRISILYNLTDRHRD
jgi:hypothetical protein